MVGEQKPDIGSPKTPEVEKKEDIVLDQESLDELKFQLKRAEEEHAQMLQASQNEPRNSELRAETDKAYTKWSRINTEIEKITKKEK